MSQSVSRHLSLQKLASTLSNLDTAKFANLLGDDSEVAFEQAFGQLAYQKVKDRVPQFVQYLKGFQLVDRDNDNTKALGVFGFQVNGRWFYIPAFFKNNRVKGTELLYVKDQGRFTRSSEGRINAILSETQELLGDGYRRDHNRDRIGSPNYRKLVRPPIFNSYKFAELSKSLDADKLASALAEKQGPRVQNWSLPALVMFSKIAADQSVDALLVPRLMQESLVATAAMDYLQQKYAGLRPLCEKYYGADHLDIAKRELAAKFASILHARKMAAVRYPSSMSLLPFNKVAASVRIYTATSISYGLSESEQEALARDGYTIRDERKDEDRSKLVNVQECEQLMQPTCAGVYHALTSRGVFQEMFIAPITRAFPSNSTKPLCLSLDSKPDCTVCNGEVFVLQDATEVQSESCREKTKAAFENFSSTKDLSENEIYVCMLPHGETSAPFRVRKKFSDGTYVIDFKDCHECCSGRLGPFLPLPIYAKREPNYVRTLERNMAIAGEDVVLIPNEGQEKFTIVRNVMRTPITAKFIAVNPKPDAFNPGDLTSFRQGIRQKTANLRITANGQECLINGSPSLTYKQALFTLVQNYGLSQEDAKEAIKLAEVNRYRAEPIELRLLKPQNTKMSYTFDFRDGQNIEYEAPSEQEYTLIGKTPMQVATAFQSIIPEMEADGNHRQFESVIDKDPARFEMSLQEAEQAGRTGRKDVFDVAMLSTMLKAMGDRALNTDAVGVYEEAVDNLARHYFKFLWHGDDYEDRYGSANMPELEDMLLNNFENLDELALKLKQKNVSSAAMFGSSDESESADN